MNPAYFDAAAEYLPDFCFDAPPDLGVILGSGWGDALACDDILLRVPYSELPGLGGTTVEGHSGEFLLFERGGKRVERPLCCCRGRRVTIRRTLLRCWTGWARNIT